MVRLSETCRFLQSSSFWEARCALIGQLSGALWLAEYLKRRAGRYDDIYRMDEIKSLSFHIMLYRVFRGVAKYIVYGTFSSFGWLCEG